MISGTAGRTLLWYLALLAIFLCLVFWILEEGRRLEFQRDGHPAALTPAVETRPPPREAPAPDGPLASSIRGFAESLQHPLGILLLQIVVILTAARVSGVIVSRLGQPEVMGEIIAGILLGPSLLGLLFPGFSSFLFPARSLPILQLFSQLGLILFMFIIGTELDLQEIRRKAQAAVAISHASIMVPYLLGVLLSLALYERHAPAAISFFSFALFMGTAMSITAFPVLARIIQERGLSGSPLGSLALACAAADDVTAWCILGTVIALVRAGAPLDTLVTLLLFGIYFLFMVRVVKPALARVLAGLPEREGPGKTRTALVFAVLFVSALFTEVIGIHALFGAFLAGAILPQGPARTHLTESLRSLSLLVLLPLFFALAGLRTEIGLLGSLEEWLTCALVTGVAIAGKFGGTAIFARLTGQTWRDSSILGILMNTRGLMELIVLNVGYDMGILTPEVFSMMVIMALVTTFMAGPTLALLRARGTEAMETKEAAIRGP